MRRRLFNFLAAVSLVLFVATAVLWVRSYFLADFVRLASEPTPLQITSEEQAAAWEKMRTQHRWVGMHHFRYVGTAVSRGAWHVFAGIDGEMTVQDDIPPPRARFGSNAEDFLMIDDSDAMRLLSSVGENHRFAGFGYFHIDLGPNIETYRLTVPLWAACLATLLLPAWRARKYVVRQRRPLVGQCLACGYDLTGNVSGVCPECGMPTPAKSAAGAPT